MVSFLHMDSTEPLWQHHSYSIFKQRKLAFSGILGRLNMETLEATIPRGRRRLAAVVRRGKDIIGIDDVVSTLSVGRTEATKLLSRWTRQGWLRRVGPGAYAAAQLESLESEQVLDDPWVLVPALYDPAYVGGWSAAEHWDLTEQIFRQILVMTTRSVRERRQTRHGTQFILRHIQERRLFGTKPVWRSRSRVAVSDVHRTVIDLLDDPSVGGGIQHVADCLTAYLRHENRDDGLLMDYAGRFGNGAVYKRLGFLVENHPGAESLAQACQARLTSGNARLDPCLESPRLVSRWRLWVPANWAGNPAHD